MKMHSNFKRCCLVFIVALSCAVCMAVVNEAWRRQKIMNGVYNLKILGQAMLEYSEQNDSLPVDDLGNILFHKIHIPMKKLKKTASPDIFSCKGIDGNYDDKKKPLAVGYTEMYYDPFTMKRYQIQMIIEADGSVRTRKISKTTP